MVETINNLTPGDWLDVAFAAGIVWCVSWGLIRGLVWEVINLAGVALGFVLAGAFYRALHAYSGLSFLGAQALVYCVLFGGSWGTVKLANYLIHRILVRKRDGGLGFSNRVAGGLFGVLRGSLIGGFVAFFAAGVSTSKVPLGDQLESTLGASRVVRFARSHPDLLARFRATALLGDASAAVLDRTARWVVDGLEIEDAAVRERAVEALTPLLADPELLGRLGDSPTATGVARRFAADPDFSAFMAQSPVVATAVRRHRFGAPELVDVLRADPTRELLKHPRIRQLMLEVDLSRIRAELAAPDSSPTPQEDPPR